jgi:EAL domain-containing protein (putative c-di-GMP-specific phosphodiesterase class I)
MRGLRALGVRIALDDFGTGYSSLSYLKSFPFDKIKIDRSFISEIEESSEACAIVEAVTSLGKSLGITITAEGVENRQQLDRIRQRGCDEAQGFFFSRPVPADQVLATLERLDEAAMWWSDAPRRA